MHPKISKGAYIALSKIAHDLPADSAHLTITSTPHGPRREVLAELYATPSKKGEFLGVLAFTLDSRNPHLTAADDCCGRAANHFGKEYGALRGRLIQIGIWPVSKK
ncbi:hypothetical protein HYPSUDRAFT_207759 [Hypholoma sublateritium FD-334 SS-4]|uniref:Uncharacterized protein n=1 Tax=Hypholoma sublateritium (strain FD-334 SS-4) TaxID=945553 RepID=A0A0D2KLQ0_HYPSF|nr:hypothetical protein HYPSUDRAFT_207759 [Hypholoma sublateritium FD-334 SS-4]